MASLPKGFKTDINIQPSNIGSVKRQEYLDDIGEKGTFLPKPILEEDMDKGFIEFVNKDLSIIIDGVKVPVYFFTLQKWTEFSQTWESSDKFKNMTIPFVTIVRHPDIQEGTNQAGLWNIPGKRTYTYFKVPTNDGIRVGYDNYKVPQPTSIDITYEVRLFANKLRNVNLFSRVIRKAFQSRQHYININGHPIPIISDSTGNESNVEDFDNRRYYVVMYEMKMLGYILDSDDFEIIPTINRTSINLSVDIFKSKNTTPFSPTILNNNVTYNVIFNPLAISDFTFISQYDIDWNLISEIVNTTRIIIKINNISVFDGTVLNGILPIKKDDIVYIKTFRNINLITSFQLNGFVIL